MGLARWAQVRPELDLSGTAVVGRVGRAATLLQERLTAALAPLGLGLGEYSVLAILRSHDEAGAGMAPSAIARATFLSSGGVANLLRRLESRGLVARRARADDRRGVAVRLTSRGAALVDDAVVAVTSLEARLVAPLDPAQRDALAAGLSALLVHLEGAGGTP